jgi:hypothetical protein
MRPSPHGGRSCDPYVGSDRSEQVGFDVAALEHTELPMTPPFARPAVIGTAVPINVADQAGAAHAKR